MKNTSKNRPRQPNVTWIMTLVVITAMIAFWFVVRGTLHEPSPTPTPVPLTATAALVVVPSTTFVSITPSATAIPITPTLFSTVTANAQWTPQTQSFNGVAMVLVPPGCFDMGSTVSSDGASPINHQCSKQPFWIDKDLVTNEQFTSLGGTAANASNWTGANRPRESITWFEARDFCVLRGARLPTEAEWEYAARGPDSLAYPWGNDLIAANAVYFDNSNNQTADVGPTQRAAGASWVGAYDMAGNVWEWISSSYRAYPYDAKDGRESNELTNNDKYRVLRGGAWDLLTSYLRSADRFGLIPSGGNDTTGFRCARS